MFIYKKNLQYPVRIANPNPALAKVIISQYGGPNGELGASLRYLSQRFAMPSDEVKGILTDIGTEDICLFVRRAKNIRITHGCGQGTHCLEEAFRQAADNLHLAPGSADMLIVSMQTNRRTPISISQLAAWGTSLKAWLGQETQCTWGIAHDDTLPEGTVKTTLLCAWQGSEIPPAG